MKHCRFKIPPMLPRLSFITNKPLPKSLLPLAIMLPLLLAACAPPPPEPAQELDFVTLFSDVDFWDLPDWSLEEGSISAEISRRTGLAINSEIPPQDAGRILSLRILEDDLPDILALADRNSIHQLAISGKVWDLQELLERYCPDSHLLSGGFPEDMKQELVRRDGAWYAYPSHINSMDAKEIWGSSPYYDEMDQYSTTLAVIWNRSLLDRLGLAIEDLQTKEQVLAAFEKAKSQKNADGKALIPLLLDGSFYQEYSLTVLNNSFGAENVGTDGHYANRWLHPAAKEALSFVNTALRKGYASTKDLVANNTKIKSYMASGRVLCFIGNTANAGIAPSEWVSSGPILSESGSRPVLGRDTHMASGWLHTLVSKDCKCPEKIARWLDYMSSEEGMMINNYGFEGTDYYKNPDGTIQLTEACIQKRESYAATGYSAWWNFGNIAWERTLFPPPAEEDDSYQTKLIECALGSYPGTYIFNSALFSLPQDYITPDSELGQIQEETALFTENQISRIIAARTDQEFEEAYQYFLSHLEELGIQRLDQAIDRQFQKNCAFYGETIENVNGR